MTYNQLPWSKVINKEENKTKLSKFPRNDNASVLFLPLIYAVWYDETKFQQEVIQNIKNNKNLRDYLMSTSEDN